MTSAKASEMSIAQAQATYRAQADEVRTLGEKKLNMLREQQTESMQNMSRKGNA